METRTRGNSGYAIRALPTPSPEQDTSITFKMSLSSAAMSNSPPPHLPPPQTVDLLKLTDQELQQTRQPKFNVFALWQKTKKSKSEKQLAFKVVFSNPERYADLMAALVRDPDVQFMLQNPEFSQFHHLLPSVPLPPPPPPMTSPRRDGIFGPPLPIPVPEREYLWTSDAEFEELSRPNDILLILDLNGTLLYRPDRTKSQNFHQRQFVDKFIKYIMENFHVMVWSSAQKYNVQVMCQKLFSKDNFNRLVARWDRSHFPLTSEQFNSKVQVYKELQWVWTDQEIQQKHPFYHLNDVFQWDQTNTILLDDSSLKALKQPFNLIEVPEFTGHGSDNDYNSPGTVLEQVADYLEVVSGMSNVSAYMKMKPFRLNWPHSQRIRLLLSPPPPDEESNRRWHKLQARGFWRLMRTVPEQTDFENATRSRDMLASTGMSMDDEQVPTGHDLVHLADA